MTAKRYETAILFEPELPEDARKEFLGKLSGVVAGYQCEILKSDDWGNRKLAYPIGKKSNAFYTFLVYTGTRGVVQEVERNIKIFVGILRFLTTLHTGELKRGRLRQFSKGMVRLQQYGRRAGHGLRLLPSAVISCA